MHKRTLQDGASPLHHSCESGDAPIVKVLLEAPGIDVNLARKDGRTPLLAAVRGSHDGIIKALLAAGAKVNVNPSPLLDACIRGDTAVVKLLLSAKDVNPNVSQRDGSTSLSVAVSASNDAIVAALVGAGADVNHPGKVLT